MPAWLLPLLIKYGVPILIKFLEKTKAVNMAERIAVKAGYEILTDIDGLKIYSAPSDYPKTKNGG